MFYLIQAMTFSAHQVQMHKYMLSGVDPGFGFELWGQNYILYEVIFGVKGVKSKIFKNITYIKKIQISIEFFSC